MSSSGEVPALPFAATDDHEIDLAVVDLRVARAFWEGVPTGRLLARIRLDRDERDLVDLAERASGLELPSSTWDTLTARLLADVPAALERVKRAVARYGRAASDEGPLVATDPAIAALVHVLLSSAETPSAVDRLGAPADASPAEGAADGASVDALVMAACARLDDRLGRSTCDRRATAFEACLHLATLGERVQTSRAALIALGESAVSAIPLYPRGDDDVPVGDRHALLLDRAAVDEALRRTSGTSGAAGSEFTALKRELGQLVVHHGVLVAFVSLEPRSSHESRVVPPSSWLPPDFSSLESAARLAAALERGATTAPRSRAVILRGGDAALDAIGAEMLKVTAHPFASAVFADILGRASRERDVVRLVSYFAIAPDVATAAHALAVCTAPEVPTVLRAWLESILPADGSNAPAAEPGSDPDASASARLVKCVTALAPYPHLHAVVKPLLQRATELPPGS